MLASTRLHGCAATTAAATRRPLPRLQAACAAPSAAAAAARRRPLQVASSAAGGGYQLPLTNQERKARRAEAQRLGRQLCTVNLGQRGVTPSFVEGFRKALAANELVKVKVGACEEEGDELIELLSQAGDCVLVHKIGFTLTFYRQRSLPPPPPFRRVAHPGGSSSSTMAGSCANGEREEEGALEAGDELEEDAQEISAELAAYLMEDEDAYSDSDSEWEEEAAEAAEAAGPPNSAVRQAAAARAAAARRKPPPPEFTVIG